MAEIYERNEPSAWRRILWYGLWALLAIAVLWVLIWLAFFRTSSSNKKVNAPGSSSTTQHPATNTKTPASSAANTATTTPSGNGSSTDLATGSATQTGTATSPSQLADTGPGDVVVPVVASSMIASTIYYIRLRRRLLQS